MNRGLKADYGQTWFNVYNLVAGFDPMNRGLKALSKILRSDGTVAVAGFDPMNRGLKGFPGHGLFLTQKMLQDLTR